MTSMQKSNRAQSATAAVGRVVALAAALLVAGCAGGYGRLTFSDDLARKIERNQKWRSSAISIATCCPECPQLTWRRAHR